MPEGERHYASEIADGHDYITDPARRRAANMAPGYERDVEVAQPAPVEAEDEVTEPEGGDDAEV